VVSRPTLPWTLNRRLSAASVARPFASCSWVRPLLISPPHVAGPGDTGKSTFLRQLRRLFGEPFSPGEIDAFRAALPRLALMAMKLLLCEWNKERRGRNDPPKLKRNVVRAVALVEKAEDDSPLTPALAQAISLLWATKFETLLHKTFVSRGANTDLKDLPGCAK
jgi:hypothetical protein